MKEHLIDDQGFKWERDADGKWVKVITDEKILSARKQFSKKAKKKKEKIDKYEVNFEGLLKAITDGLE